MNDNFYNGSPCRKSGHTLRYKNGGGCVECDRIRSKHRRKFNENYIKGSKEYRLKNKEKLKHYMRNYHYGITETQYNALILTQNGKCAICEDDLDFNKRTHVDHKGSKIRGILCHLCNVGIGHFRDSEQFLFNAIQYLKKAKIK